MNRPELTASGGVYFLRWEAEQISVRVDRLLEDTKFTVSGEMAIRSTVPGATKHLHQARLNLTSTTSRRTLVKTLDEIWSGVEWNDAIEYACVLVLQAFREGEPARPVCDIPRREAIQYRVRPYVLENKANLLFGPGGIAKSFLAQYWSILVDTYRGVETPLECEPGTVAYLDYETDEDDFKTRIEAIQKGLGVSDLPSKILYRFCFQPLANDIASIQRIVAENSVSFLIIDSAGPACGGDPENAQAVLRYFAALRSLKITTLTVGHTQKNSDAKTPLGSSYWINMPRNIWQAKGNSEQGNRETFITLSHFKANSIERHRPTAYKFAFGDSVTVTDANPYDLPEAVEAMSLRWRLHGALKEGQRTTQALAQALQEKEDIIRMTLNRYRDKTFLRFEHGLWGLKATAGAYQ